MSFTVTLSTVLIMLAYAVPGYLLVRFRKIPPTAIAAFATFLIYVLTPFQIVYAMQQADFSPYMARYMGIALLVALGSMAGMLGIVYFFLRRHQEEPVYRICVLASALGNVGFIGLPLLQALLPHYPQMQTFASMFFMSLNIIMWTLGSWITTRDRRYMSLKKVFLNPATIAVGVGLGLLLGHVRLSGQVGGMVELMGRMSTPVCMIILGMRLATVPWKAMFTSSIQYIAVFLKLIVFPLAVLAVCSLLPVERDFVRGVFILSTVPVGNNVLSFAELLGEGQDVAANVVLLSTMLSMVTIPLMLLLI